MLKLKKLEEMPLMELYYLTHFTTEVTGSKNLTLQQKEQLDSIAKQIGNFFGNPKFKIKNN